MRNAAVAALLLTSLPVGAIAQNKPRSLHIEGAQARQLISLLVTGNSAVESSLRDTGVARIVLHDLYVMKFSTFKYDEDAPMYRLDVYSAQAKIGRGSQSVQFHEAAALYEFLSSLGVKADTSMQGSDLDADTVDCRIDPHAAFDKPQRFVCDLRLPF